MGPINANMRFQTICIILSFLSCFATKSYVQIHMWIKTSFCLNFLKKTGYRVRYMIHMFKQSPSILIFFFRVKVDAPLSSADVKFLLNHRKATKFVIPSFLWALIVIKVVQSGSAKKTVSQKIGKNIKMLVCFICMGTQDRTLIDINHHYRIVMNQHKNWT